MLTEGLGWGLLQCRSAGGEIRRGSVCGARGPVGGALLGSSRFHVWTREVPATKPQGSARFDLHRRRGKTAVRQFTCGGARGELRWRTRG